MHDNNDSPASNDVDNDSNCLRDSSDSNESSSFLKGTSTHGDSKVFFNGLNGHKLYYNWSLMLYVCICRFDNLIYEYICVIHKNNTVKVKNHRSYDD